MKGDQLSKRISALLSTMYGDEKTKSACRFGLMDAKIPSHIDLCDFVGDSHSLYGESR